MNWKYVCYTGLLLALLGSTSSAQTRHKKRANKTVAVPDTLRGGAGPDFIRWIGHEWWTLPPPIGEPLDYLSRVHTYVDQMPTLNGQGAVTASIATIYHYLIVPLGAPDGRVFVQFEVDKEGYVRHPRIAKGLRADVDSAVIAATRQLPPFVPGKQAGHAVGVSIMVPVTIPVQKQPYGAVQ